MCVFLFLLDGWRIGAPILHGCKFFSEEIKKRDTRKKTFGSFHASSAAQRFFFHHMLIVVAPHLLPQKTSPHALLCHIGLMPRVAKNQSPTWNDYPIQEVTAIFGWWASRKHDRSSSIFLLFHDIYLPAATVGILFLPKRHRLYLARLNLMEASFHWMIWMGGGVTVNLISPLLFLVSDVRY